MSDATGSEQTPAKAAPRRTTPAAILAAYKQMLALLFALTFALIVALTWYLLSVYTNTGGAAPQARGDPPLLLLVMACGVLGAFFSALIRLYNFEDLPRAVIDRQLEGLGNLHLAVYAVIPAVVGGIAAVVLYVVFAGKLLEGGAFFPAFACKPPGAKDCSSFIALIQQYGPATAADYARVLVWAFIAGFSERLVPDTLLGIARRDQKELGGEGVAQVEKVGTERS